MPRFFLAISFLIGTIVGVGMFGLPYAFSQAGFAPGFLILIIGGMLMLVLHLCYGEIILRGQGQHRLPGQVKKYFSRPVFKFFRVIVLFEMFGTLLAYLIVAGDFLHLLAPSASAFIWSLAFFAAGAILLSLGLKSVARFELAMSFLLLAMIALFSLKGWPQLQFINLTQINWSNVFLPYGVALFALAGACSVPEILPLLKSKKDYKKAIIWGSLIPLVVYVVFTAVVLGISGAQTSADAISGLQNFLGAWVIKLGAGFGLLAVATSFLTIGTALSNVLQFDFKAKKIVAFNLVCFVPLFAFLLGLRSFIVVISFLGAIFVGLEGIFIILMHARAQAKGQVRSVYTLRIPKAIKWIMLALFALGIAYQLLYGF